MGESIYRMKKGDMALQSKHADRSFKGEPGFALFWFNTPKKGKCLCVEYNPANWRPALYVTIQANWKAKKQIKSYDKETDVWADESF